jgi:prefoldin subunit 5
MTSTEKEIIRLSEKIESLDETIHRLRKSIEALTDAIDELAEGDAGTRSRRRIQIEKLSAD